MGRRIYVDGVLIEKWDDETRTYTGPDGSRPYTDDELAAIKASEQDADPAVVLADLLAPTLASMDSKLAAINTAVDELNAKQATTA